MIRIINTFCISNINQSSFYLIITPDLLNFLITSYKSILLRFSKSKKSNNYISSSLFNPLLISLRKSINSLLSNLPFPLFFLFSNIYLILILLLLISFTIFYIISYYLLYLLSLFSNFLLIISYSNIISDYSSFNSYIYSLNSIFSRSSLSFLLNYSLISLSLIIIFVYLSYINSCFSNI